MNRNNLEKYIIDRNQVKIMFTNSILTLSVLTSEIIRVFQDRGCNNNSYAIEENKTEETSFEVKKIDDHLELKTSKLIIKIYDDEKVDVYDEQENPLIIDYRGNRIPLDRQVDASHQKLAKSEGHDVAISTEKNSHYYELVKKLAADEQFYGLGDKTGFLNKRHYAYENWNTDNPEPHLESFTRLYKSVPFLIGLKNNHPYGIFFDNTYHSYFDLGKESNKYYYYTADDGNIDYYIIGGTSLKKVVENYTYLTGRTPLPQKWTLGYQQSRWGYSISAEKVEEIVDKMRKYHLPCDAIHLDIDYMDGYRVFTWRTDTYDDPKKFINKLHKLGLHIITIIDPGVKKDEAYQIYQEGLQKGYFVKALNGQVYVNKVWPGDVVYPDFGRNAVRKWWAENCKFLVDLGVDGIWDDMNEPASFNGEIPENIIFSDEDKKSTHGKMHNVYGHNMAKATYDGLKKASGKRPFVITRAAYAGTQKYSTVWTGDNQSLWVHLQMMIPQLCNLGMSGFAFAGTDIGGFGADTTPELLTRWIEAAIFSPLLRNHAALGTRSQEPWVFGEPTLSTYRKYLQLRYHFIPYLYDLFVKESKNGLPIMRPLVLNYPNDPKVKNMNDEYMVGTKILVAPVVEEGKDFRAVYLPQGKWIDFWNNVTYSGNNTVLINAPLDKLPLFIKKDTILPWGEVKDHISSQPDEKMIFRVFGEHGNYLHYQDNGTDFAYKHGEYNLYEINVDGNRASINLKKHGYEPVYQRIELRTIDKKIDFIFKDQKYLRI